MVTNIFRIIATRSFKSISFTNKIEEMDSNMKELGLYVHIPFCEKLCPFCPYNKVEFDKNLANEYKDALIKEIENMGVFYGEKNITSVYFGGGTPALMIDSLGEIIKALKYNFNIKANIGIELHPRDINEIMLRSLIDIGFDMVSIGIQSFNKDNLKTLGREYINGAEKINLVKNAGFKVIDVDLIFGIKGQTKENLIEDFEIAIKNGATQVSTYPFIDFSYAKNKSKPMGKYEKKELLQSLESISENLGLKRTSVWTFGKEGISKYSSITRDSYIGFGPSAATLTNNYFKINTFSVPEYIKVMDTKLTATSLTMDFTKRVRALYWGFWNAYTLEFNSKSFKDLFNEDLDKFFKIELFLARVLGMIEKIDSGYKLTKRGTYIYHLLEQHYTHQYIDKTLKICSNEPWPKEIKLY